MTPRIVAAVAALALAGAASAQPGAYSSPGAAPSSSSGSNQTSAPDGPIDPLPGYVTTQARAAMRSAMRDYRAACAWDRETLCGDKKTDAAAGRCLRYHRLKLTAGCKTAVDGLELAERGAY